MNRDVELGKQIAQSIKDRGLWVLSYRDFVQRWECEVDLERFDHEGGETECYEVLLLALHGFSIEGGIISFLSIPIDEEEEESEGEQLHDDE